MSSKIYGRESFIEKIAAELGRPIRKEGVLRPQWKKTPQYHVLAEADQDELVQVLMKQCEFIHTNVVLTDVLHLRGVLEKSIEEFGNGSVITWDDPRFSEYGIASLLNAELPAKNIAVSKWDPLNGREENIELAEKANVGITFSDLTLAESGTVVLYSDAGKGRSVSLLPSTYIAIIPKSSIVPRMTQAAEILHNKVDSGEQVASCINFISGPSNSADIEMNLVVGVHGPIRATYIIVDDK
ncbi:LutC/YkgG family protein [Metabacillus arenae]|uniref:Lactate utilization protein C n=1 Tax=Metabacillus arenae TaxID=2771434 RepID=A0A926NGY1_9BACI|nr:lactate utilization protein C [Metabacillus arenae]MBD1380353.1 lactate utilization protein C [Metabacillus arenae]